MAGLAENKYYMDQVYSYAVQLRDHNLRERNQFIVDPGKIKYVIYARKSTTDKKHQTRSIKDQIAECKAFAKAKGLQYVDIITEEQTAKVSGKRGEFERMLKAIKNKHYNGIISWHPDRLARNMKDAGTIIDWLDKGDVADLQFPSYTFVNDASGKMALGIQFVLAKQYSDNLSNNTKRGNSRIAKEGKVVDKPKFGYIANISGYPIPDGNNFKLLETAWRMVIDSKTLEEIAEYLNSNHFSYKGNELQMSKQKLSKLFRDTYYAGLWIYGEHIIDIKKAYPDFKQMLTPEEFCLVRAKLEGKRSFKRSISPNLLFKKMITCAFCGRMMTGGKSKGGGGRYLIFRCPNKECERYKQKARKKGVRAKYLFEFVDKVLTECLDYDKSLYESFEKGSKQVLSQKLSEINMSLRIKEQALRRISDSKSGYLKLLDKETNAEAIKRISADMNKVLKDEETLNNDIEKLNLDRSQINFTYEQEKISYESFLNFFKKLRTVVKKHEDQYLVDRIIRMVFLNFEVGSEEVLYCRLKPRFERIVKMGDVSRHRSITVS